MTLSSTVVILAPDFISYWQVYIFLSEGNVSVRISPSVSKILQEGDTFGELALLDDSPRTATCIAISEVHVAFVEKKDF